MKSHHILNSASNLFGASVVIVTALHISRFAHQTYADEIAFAAAVVLLASCLASYQSIRSGNERMETVADRLFVVAQILLLLAVLSFWF